MYEPQALQLSRVLMQPLPPFYPESGKRSSWSTVARLRSQTEASFLPPAKRANAIASAAATEEEHSF